MNLLKRAFLYITRKKSKMILLFLFLFIMSMFVLTGLSILDAADQSALSLRQAVGGSIKLELDEGKKENWSYQQGVGGVMIGYVGDPITDGDIQKITEIEGITAYNGVGDGSVFAKDFEFFSGINFGPGSDYSALPSVTNSEYFNYFKRGAFRLAEGRHINADDDHAVLISTVLAQKNGLKLGDKITVQCCYDVGEYPDVQLTIVGIYEYMQDGHFYTTCTDKRNRLIVDHKAMQEIMQTDVVEYAHGVDFYIDDPRDMERIAGEIHALDLNWNCFKLTIDNSAYEVLASSLTAMQNMVKGLIIGLIIVSIGILTLVLNMWIKQRMYETGILLSIGVDKKKIILQYIIEVLLIAMIAFGVSFFSSKAIAQGASDLIFHQVAESQPVVEIDNPDDGSEYLDITGQYIPYDTSEMVMPDNIKVEVNWKNLLFVYLIGTLIIIISVSIASMTVIRMKPKEILSKMS